MITIISGTNRKDNEAFHFAKHYQQVFQSKTDQAVKLLDLATIAHDWFHPEMYEEGKQSPSLKNIQDEYMIPAEKFVFVISEYNGGFPGAVKLFLDACSVREYQKTFKGKKAALVGIASGRAGNLRGMDHLTGVLNHVGTIVFPNKLPISSIDNLVDVERTITDTGALKVIENQVLGFLEF